MQVRFDFRFIQKEGNEASEYEDAFSPREELLVAAKKFRCALSDGASESTYAGDWARILVDGFVNENFDDSASLEHALPGFCDVWQGQIDKASLSWFAKEKLTQGAFATFLGLELSHGLDGGQWECHAVGDTCLFHSRNQTVLNIFPLTSTHQFSNHPDLLASAYNNGSLIQRYKPLYGQWRAGDQFILATDAIACCIINEITNEARDFAHLSEMLFEEFEEMVRLFRNRELADGSSCLKNDDVSILRVSVDE